LRGDYPVTYVIAWRIVLALLASFATAYIFERKGRDVRTGGIVGAAVGAIGGIWFLLILWVGVYFFLPSPDERIYGLKRKFWYRWWE
jgi:hypothetical protein